MSFKGTKSSFGFLDTPKFQSSKLSTLQSGLTVEELYFTRNPDLYLITKIRLLIETMFVQKISTHNLICKLFVRAFILSNKSAKRRSLACWIQQLDPWKASSYY